MAGTWRRRILIGVLALVGALLLLAAGLVGLTRRTLAKHYAVTPETITIPDDSATRESGHHLATAIAKCTGCHGDDVGGDQMEMGPMGSFPAANLTTGRGGAQRADADWVRAIRHGVAADGRPLVFMPSGVYAALSAEDLGAIIAWARSMPPVDRELRPLSIGPIGRILIALNPTRLVAAAGIDHGAPIPAAVPPGPTAKYGRYLTAVGGCTYCHGDNLAGGIKEGPPGTPPSADLRPTGPMSAWHEEDFATLLRAGQRPDGSAVDPFMPWRFTRFMTDEEISAVWAYLRGLKS